MSAAGPVHSNFHAARCSHRSQRRSQRPGQSQGGIAGEAESVRTLLTEHHGVGVEGLPGDRHANGHDVTATGRHR